VECKNFIVGLTLDVTLNNVTPPNNLLLNSYFDNFTVELLILYVLNMQTKFNKIDNFKRI